MLALTDPSTQINVSPWHRSIPPFLPLHGVFVAAADPAASKTIAAITNPFINRPRVVSTHYPPKRVDETFLPLAKFARGQTYDLPELSSKETTWQ
ncbi:hypothetical protein ACQZ40_02015 [Agrobacterium sp. 16-172Ci]